MRNDPPVTPAAADAVERGYESRDPPGRGFLLLIAGFIVVFSSLCGGLWMFYRYERSRPIAGDRPNSAVVLDRSSADAPPLQPQTGHESLDAWDLAKMRQGEDAAFEQLGWHRDERTHRFTVPATIVDDLRRRQTTRPATRAGGGAG